MSVRSADVPPRNLTHTQTHMLEQDDTAEPELR